MFLPPVVFWPLGLLRNSPLLTFTVHSDSDERTAELALRVSQQSVVTEVKPEVGSGGLARIWCNPSSDRQATVLRLVGENHRGEKPPSLGIVDLEGTRRAMQSVFCGFDWTSFDVENFTWRYEGEAYLERLKGMKTSRPAAT